MEDIRKLVESKLQGDDDAKREKLEEAARLHEARTDKQTTIADLIRTWGKQTADLLIDQGATPIFYAPGLGSYWVVCVEQTGAGKFTKRGILLSYSGDLFTFEDENKDLPGEIIHPKIEGITPNQTLVPYETVEEKHLVIDPATHPKATEWQNRFIDYSTEVIKNGVDLPPVREWLRGDSGRWRQI